MDSFLKDFNPTVNRTLHPLTTQPGSSILKLLLVLYGATIAPKLPDKLLKYFDYVPFKIFVVFLIVWTSNYDPAMALLIALSFYASFNVLNAKKAFESFSTLEEYIPSDRQE